MPMVKLSAAKFRQDGDEWQLVKRLESSRKLETMTENYYFKLLKPSFTFELKN
jgi:hypothetical protein